LDSLCILLAWKSSPGPNSTDHFGGLDFQLVAKASLLGNVFWLRGKARRRKSNLNFKLFSLTHCFKTFKRTFITGVHFWR
jgi:hypothetical protein